jgi:hypothetical protein
MQMCSDPTPDSTKVLYAALLNSIEMYQHWLDVSASFESERTEEVVFKQSYRVP